MPMRSTERALFANPATAMLLAGSIPTKLKNPSVVVDAQRILFHAQLAILEDLHHGIARGDHRYTDAARRPRAALFARP